MLNLPAACHCWLCMRELLEKKNLQYCYHLYLNVRGIDTDNSVDFGIHFRSESDLDWPHSRCVSDPCLTGYISDMTVTLTGYFTEVTLTDCGYVLMLTLTLGLFQM